MAGVLNGHITRIYQFSNSFAKAYNLHNINLEIAKVVLEELEYKGYDRVLKRYQSRIFE